MTTERARKLARHLRPLSPRLSSARPPERYRRAAVRLAERMDATIAAYVYGVHPGAVHRWRREHKTLRAMPYAAQHTDFDETAEPPLGTLRAVTARHGLTIEEAREVMGLPPRKRPRVPLAELRPRQRFRFNAIEWVLLTKGRRFAACKQIRDKGGELSGTASIALYLYVEPLTERAPIR